MVNTVWIAAFGCVWLGMTLSACTAGSDADEPVHEQTGGTGATGGKGSGKPSGAGGDKPNGTAGTTTTGRGGSTSGTGGSGGDRAGTGGNNQSSGGSNTSGSGGTVGDLGLCSGSADECEAAREFNAYRVSHFAQGECNNVLVWNDKLGKFAHDWALKTFDNPEHSFGPYGESLGSGDDGGIHDMVFFISDYDPPGEDHCAPDGSFVASHHCNTMRCDAFTIGVGVVRKNGKLYVVVEFGGKDGASI